MNISDVFMILAVLLSPFIAVFAQRKVDLSREKNRNKLWIFRTLMATRGDRLSLEHVQALNSIDVYFDNPKKDKETVDRWNEYFDNFSQTPRGEMVNDAAAWDNWSTRADDLLAKLLSTMGKTLGYDFEALKIKRGIYCPKGHGDEKNDNLIMRKAMVSILDGSKAFPIKIIS